LLIQTDCGIARFCLRQHGLFLFVFIISDALRYTAALTGDVFNYARAQIAHTICNVVVS